MPGAYRSIRVIVVTLGFVAGAVGFAVVSGRNRPEGFADLPSHPLLALSPAVRNTPILHDDAQIQKGPVKLEPNIKHFFRCPGRRLVDEVLSPGSVEFWGYVFSGQETINSLVGRDIWDGSWFGSRAIRSKYKDYLASYKMTDEIPANQWVYVTASQEITVNCAGGGGTTTSSPPISGTPTGCSANFGCLIRGSTSPPDAQYRLAWECGYGGGAHTETKGTCGTAADPGTCVLCVSDKKPSVASSPATTSMCMAIFCKNGSKRYCADQPGGNEPVKGPDGYGCPYPASQFGPAGITTPCGGPGLGVRVAQTECLNCEAKGMVAACGGNGCTCIKRI